MSKILKNTELAGEHIFKKTNLIRGELG